jgi:hypothetical protein
MNARITFISPIYIRVCVCVCVRVCVCVYSNYMHANYILCIQRTALRLNRLIYMHNSTSYAQYVGYTSFYWPTYIQNDTSHTRLYNAASASPKAYIRRLVAIPIYIGLWLTACEVVIQQLEAANETAHETDGRTGRHCME